MFARPQTITFPETIHQPRSGDIFVETSNRIGLQSQFVAA
jgi:hypothetical protein